MVTKGSSMSSPLSNGKLTANDPKGTFITASMTSFTSYGRHFPPTVEKIRTNVRAESQLID